MPSDLVPSRFTRRALLGSSLALGSGLLLPGWARAGTHGLSPGSAMPGSAMPGGDAAGSAGPTDVLSGDRISLTLGHSRFRVGARTGYAATANGTVPGPLIRLREGQDARITVRNALHEQSSIHWHGLLVPFQMDGVPGISFPGIDAGESFDYAFPVRQSGTYWYHSHSGMQEGMGLYGPIVIDPANERDDHARADREHILVLADWSFVHPHELMVRLKQASGYYNRQRQTIAGLIAGKDQPLGQRIEWGGMLMDPSDIADITGSTYSYLINGHDSAGNWTGLFTPGERVRLRIINASAMTNFNLRIPGLAMTVIAADGMDVRPVETDEFQIAVAETYDVIVSPPDARPYGVIAEAIDRSGQCRATLSPRPGLAAEIPPLRARPLLSMRDMGMGDMGNGDMGDMAPRAGGTTMNPGAADSASMDHAMPMDDSMPMDHAMPMTDSMPMDHAVSMGHSMSMRDGANAPGVKLGPGVATIAPMPVDRMGDRPTGLEAVDHRVLTYAQLRARTPRVGVQAPDRSVDVHLTGNMERYMWSFDGVKFSENPAPIAFRLGERVRVRLINDTMMPHPIHLHGHFFELVTGEPGNRALKHTVNVLPGGIVTFDLHADAPGDWAFHCHMLLHMHAGMFRVVTVRADTVRAANANAGAL